MTTRQASVMFRKHEIAPVATSCSFVLGYDLENGQPEYGGMVNRESLDSRLRRLDPPAPPPGSRFSFPPHNPQPHRNPQQEYRTDQVPKGRVQEPAPSAVPLRPAPEGDGRMAEWFIAAVLKTADP